MASRKSAKAHKPEKREQTPDGELPDAALDAVSGGAHGCPSCPHTPGVGFSDRINVLVDGSVFPNDKIKR